MVRPFVVVGLGLAVFVACGGGAERPPPAEPAASGCPTSGMRECKTSEDCGGNGLHCTGGRCYASQAGCPCSDVEDCGTAAHCSQGACHANAAGSPCNETKDCGPRAHCTVGTCYANTAGSPCSAPDDCGPGSKCVSGTCN